MKRIFSSVFIFMLIFTLSSCGSKEKKEDEKPEYKEQVKQEISVEKGGMLKTSDESVSIEVPGGALDSDTTITMTVYDVSNYPEANDKDAEVISAVVEFEPSGIVFKKPVFITMKSLKDVKDKVITAAVYRDSKGEWSYSEHGAAVKISGVDEAGDPIMTTAAGDPIMLSAAGDPIMMSAAGDPIMLSAAGDPIMVTAAGDPIMNSAAGDPIMMTTGHFTAYTFIAVNPKEPVEEPDDDDKDSDDDTSDVEVSEDDDEISDEDDDEISDEDENDIEMSEDDDEISDVETADEDADEPVNDEDGTPVVVDEDENPVVDEDTDTTPVPEPELLVSKVLCTGQTHCTNGESIIECPKEGEEFYGQDAQYVVSKGCIPHKYTIGDLFEEEGATANYQLIDESTGLRWVVFFNNSSVNHEAAEEKCAALTAGGYEWRLPTVKEALSIADHDRYNPAANTFYFSFGGSFWTGTPVADDEEGKFWLYSSDYGYVDPDGYGSAYYTACVSGEEYGKSVEIEVKTIGGDNVGFDSATNLMWAQPSSDNMSWKEALKYCENLTYAGKSDWRVPNKNELLTLIDYSATSYGGYSYFWTSTFMPYYGSEGIFIVDLDGNINYYTPYSDEYEYSVLCVRSDTKPLPEGKTIPYCNESRIAPCEDAATGRVWSSSDYSGIYRDELWWKYKAVQCRESNEGGISQWRIPTIDEIRELLPLYDRLKPDGECKVTTECDDYYNAACFDSGVCSPGNEIIMSSLFDYKGVYISGTMSHQGVESEGLDYSWVVDLTTGSLKSYNKHYGDRSESRCIMDLSIPALPEFPHTDSENHLIWSSLSKYNGYWYDAVRHCKTLNEGGSNNWRVPTIAELNTLVKSDPSSDPDQPNVTGRYSVFSDISTLWSSTYEGELKVFDFMNAYEAGVSDDFYEAKTRCVRSEDAPANVSEIQYPFENIDGLVWSELSEETFYGLYSSRDYCSGLNTLNYGGYSEWRLPRPEELATLIRKSVCTNKSDFNSSNYSATCDIRTFDGYSILGDADIVISEGDYDYVFLYDFAKGSMNRYVSFSGGRVRCVVRVEGQV